MSDVGKVVELLEKQSEQLTDLTEGLDTFKTETTERFEKIEGEIEKGRPMYVDDQGKPVAPFVTSGEVGKDSRPLYISNVVKAMNEKSWEFAKEERGVHEELIKAGYHPKTVGGFMFPLAPEHIPDEHRELRERISKRMHVYSDPSELASILKRYPQLAPAFDILQKDLKLGDDTLGGFLVPIVQADRVIDLLRNRVVVQRAGATEIALPPSGNLTWPRASSDPSFSYDDPDRTTDIVVTDATFGSLRFQAKNLTGAVAIPNDLIRYSSPSVEVVVRQMMAARAAVVEDRSYLTGIGSSFEPKGVLSHETSTIPGTKGRITLHTAFVTAANGDTFSPEDVALMLAKQEESNDPDMPTAWIMRPLMWANVMNKRADAAVAGDRAGPFMFPVSRGDMGAAPQKRLLDIPVLTTRQVPNDRVKGASSDLTVIFLANWRRAIIARSGAFEMAASEHVRFLRDQTVIKAILRNDFGIEFEESFVFVDQVDIDLI